MNFRRWVVFTFLVHVLVVVLDKGGGVVLYLLCANRPAQHGVSGIAASLPFLLGALANLGFATALVYFVRRGRYTAQRGFETAMAVALFWGGLVAALAIFATLWLLPRFGPEWAVDPWLAVPICAVVPLLLVASYANSTQLATDRVRDYGVVHLVTSLAFLPAFFGCFFAFGGDVGQGHVPLGVAWGRLLSTAVVAAVALWLVRSVVRLRVRVDRDVLACSLRYGWKANLTSTLTYLNHRIDLPVLGAVLLWRVPDGGDPAAAQAAEFAKTQIAFYSMSVTWAELVWHFPEAMRDLFFSKVAGSTHEQARTLTPMLARLGIAVSLLGGLAIVFAVDPVMAGITAVAKGSSASWYDKGWSAAVGASLWALLPGTVAFTVSKVLQADLAARNRLQICVNAQMLVLVTMLALDVALIPAHAATGAALASTIAYVVATVYTVVVYARETGTRIGDCLWLRGSDLRLGAEILGAVLRKLRRRPG